MSNALAVSELARKTSLAFIMILLPEIISKEEPAGIGALLIRNAGSPELGKRYTLPKALLPVLFEIKTLSRIKVAPPLTVITFVAELDVTSAVERLDFVVFVNVFAMSA
jgi:hypothetical protein